jgi:flagellar basal body-associated protein FliL
MKHSSHNHNDDLNLLILIISYVVVFLIGVSAAVFLIWQLALAL